MDLVLYGDHEGKVNGSEIVRWWLVGDLSSVASTYAHCQGESATMYGESTLLDGGTRWLLFPDKVNKYFFSDRSQMTVEITLKTGVKLECTCMVRSIKEVGERYVSYWTENNSVKFK